MYDVIVSGAGPAGSKCAEVVAKAGYKVALIEKDINWRKPCGGVLGAGIIEKYYPQLKQLNPIIINSVSMYSADYHKIEDTWESKDSIVIDRLVFDNLLRNIAVESGAKLFNENLSYDFILKNDKKIGIKTKSSSGTKEYYGKIIVIADGMSSKLALKSGLRTKWKTMELGIAKCAILKGKNKLEKNRIYIYFRPYKGYGWIFPLDENRFNIGCGSFEEANLKYNLNQIYEEFINDPHIKRYFPESNYQEIWKGSYPLSAIGVLEKSLFGDNLMIIGDAAGFVSPISGEGLLSSITSGQIAAETAINALKSNNISKQALKAFKKHLDIKNIIMNFRLKYSLVKFFFENKGEKINRMFMLAANDDDFKKQALDLFFSGVPPPKEFFSKLYNADQPP